MRIRLTVDGLTLILKARENMKIRATCLFVVSLALSGTSIFAQGKAPTPTTITAKIHHVHIALPKKEITFDLSKPISGQRWYFAAIVSNDERAQIDVAELKLVDFAGGAKRLIGVADSTHVSTKNEAGAVSIDFPENGDAIAVFLQVPRGTNLVVNYNGLQINHVVTASLMIRNGIFDLDRPVNSFSQFINTVQLNDTQETDLSKLPNGDVRASVRFAKKHLLSSGLTTGTPDGKLICRMEIDPSGNVIAVSRLVGSHALLLAIQDALLHWKFAAFETQTNKLFVEIPFLSVSGQVTSPIL